LTIERNQQSFSADKQIDIHKEDSSEKHNACTHCERWQMEQGTRENKVGEMAKEAF